MPCVRTLSPPPPGVLRAAEALLDDKQAAAAERLARQALHQGYAPLGVGTYAHTCFTQHINMLRKWGTEVRGVDV